MKKIILAALMATILSPSIAHAEEASAEQGIDKNFSATVGFTSQYAFRGLAQSDENPAIQGSIDYAHENGLYAGVWGSNVDFNDGDEANIETDLYAGWKTEIKGFLLDGGFIYYAYPGADSDLNYDFFEAKAAVGYDFEFLNLNAGLNYSPNYFADSGDAWYISANADIPLPYDFKIMTHFGHQDIDDEDAFGSPDYNDWSAGLGYSYAGFNFALNYIGTDLDDGDECVRGWCDERVVFSVSRSFGGP